MAAGQTTDAQVNAQPQWSPALSAGNGARDLVMGKIDDLPQWSPALSAGNGPDHPGRQRRTPGTPQWSPALSAGNGRASVTFGRGYGAAMEPSLIGWEWLAPHFLGVWDIAAAMEPSLIGWEWGRAQRNRNA